MSITREDHELIADVVADAVRAEVERLRADLLEKMFALRTPTFQLTPLGELYCDGQRVGDVRPLFQRVVAEALTAAGHLKPKEAGDDDC